MQVLEALRGHPTLQVLSLNENDARDCTRGHGGGDVRVAERAAGKAIAELIAADSPALRSLTFQSCGFTATALGPVFDALPRNFHLQRLACRQNLHGGQQIILRGMDARFARERVLPGVRACTSLRHLDWDWGTCGRSAALGEMRGLMEARWGLPDAAPIEV